MPSKKTDQFISFASSLLQGLPALICLEDKNGQPLPSKAALVSENAERPALEYQTDYPYLLADPRINFIKRLLGSLLSRFKLSECDQELQPLSFRLKHLPSWLIQTGLDSLLGQMSWNCRANCIFCYQKGNPPFMRHKQRITRAEIETRLKYYAPGTGLGLVGGLVFESDEVLNNPYLANILTTLRKKDRQSIIKLTTNGTSLTPQVITLLAKVSPVFLHFSLNSADPKTRKWLMRDPRPQVAIESLPLLKKHRIPFIISIVVWPGLPFSDIEKTIRYAEKNDAYLVALCLPGYSRFFSKTKLFSARAFWKKAVEHFQPRLKGYSIPVLMVPHSFVQIMSYEKLGLPIVVGAVKNSPAYDSGIRPGDLIKEINGRAVDSTREVIDGLSFARSSASRLTLQVARAGALLDIDLDSKAKGRYPYSVSYEASRYDYFGLTFGDEFFNDSCGAEICRYIRASKAKNILVLASIRAKPFITLLLKGQKLPDARIRVVTPRNHFFGGSIDSGDLLTVSDCIRCVKLQQRHFRPDLVLVPASPFGSWGRDLTGRVVLDIEREVGVPVGFIYGN